MEGAQGMVDNIVQGDLARESHEKGDASESSGGGADRAGELGRSEADGERGRSETFGRGGTLI